MIFFSRESKAGLGLLVLVHFLLFTNFVQSQDLTISANSLQVCPAPRPVTWRYVTNSDATATGIFGHTTNWDAGAESVEQITGNGYVEYLIEGSGYKMIGLSVSNNNPGYWSINYAIYLDPNGNMSVFENGSGHASLGTYAAGMKIKIAVESGIVKYYYNGVLQYTSTTQATLPLIVDVSMVGSGFNNVMIQQSNTDSPLTFTADTSQGGTYQWYVNDVLSATSAENTFTALLLPGDLVKCVVGNLSSNILSISGTSIPTTTSITAADLTVCPAPRPVTWRYVTNSDATSTGIFGHTTNWDAGAESVEQITRNGYVEYLIEGSGYKMIGLSVSNNNPGYWSINYAIYLDPNGNMSVFENGSGHASLGTYAAGMKIKIAVESGIVKYYYNEVLQYTSTIPATLPLIVDVSMVGSGFNKVMIQQSNIGAPLTFTADSSRNGTYQWYVNKRSVGTLGATLNQSGLIGGDTVKAIFLPSDMCAARSLSNAEIVISKPLISSTAIIKATDLTVCPAPRPVTWTYVTNSNVTATGIFGHTTNWDAGAESVEQITGNGYVEYLIEGSGYKMIGLSVSNNNPSYWSINYAIYLDPNGYMSVFENGSGHGNLGTYEAGMKIKIAVEGGIVKYYYNGVLQYTSTTPATLPLIVDVSMVGSGFNNVMIQQSNTGAPLAFTVDSPGSGTYQWYVNKQSVGTLGTTLNQSGLIGGDTVKAVFLPSDMCSANAVSNLLPISSCKISNYTVINTADSGAGSLRAAIDSANANSDYSIIDFYITETGPYVINNAGSLTLNHKTFIDGSSQPGYNAVTKNPVVEVRNTDTNNSEYIFDLASGSKGSTIQGLYLSNSQQFGLNIQADSVTVKDNVFNHGRQNGNPLRFVSFSGAGSYSKIIGNTFGTDSTGADLGLYHTDSLTTAGIYMQSYDYGQVRIHDIRIGGSGPSEANKFAFLNRGVVLYDANLEDHIDISVNTFTSMDYASVYFYPGTNLENNQPKPVPVITTLNGTLLQGTATSGDTIQIYLSNPRGIDLVQYLGKTIATGGTWSFDLTTGIGGLPDEQAVYIANATDASGTSSPYCASYHGGAVPPCSPTDIGINWTHQRSYDEYGSVIAQSVTYSDNLGRTLQTQTRNMVENKILAASTYYDFQGAPAIKTLPAPIASTCFSYVPNFATASTDATNYNSIHFDVPGASNTLEAPIAIGQSSPLGAYYSTSNAIEPYTPASNFPYSRSWQGTIGSVSRATLPGDALHMGTQKENKAGAFIVLNELDHYMQLKPYYSVGTYPITLSMKATKTVSIDANQNESVSFYDASGNLIATCLSGNANATNNASISVSVQNTSSFDIHVPSGTENSVNFSSIPTVTDLINGTITNNVSHPGFFRITKTDGIPTTITYNLNYYNFTYYFYDDANRLVATISPNQVNRASNNPPPAAAITTYSYNTVGGLLSTTSPDEGKKEYVYRKDGQVRFSQNARQKAQNKFSYCNYDALGRPTEAGEYWQPASGGITFENALGSYGGNTNAIIENIDNDLNYNNTTQDTDGIDDPNCHDVVYTLYDVPASPAIPNRTQAWLNLNVSTTYKKAIGSDEALVSQTWYSYDEMDKLAWTVQMIQGMDEAKTIDYTYDALGNVTNVIYQNAETADRFEHVYSYDAMKRLHKVQTRAGAVTSTLTTQANYSYYLHGPLKRTELANGLQGIDYTYTAQGWLKGINEPSLTHDPGGDGIAGSNHVSFQKDIFGMALEYYDNDYISQAQNPAFATTSNLTGVGQYAAFFNGNIRSVSWSPVRDLTVGKVSQYAYKYDQKYQLLSADYGHRDASNNFVNDNIYKTSQTVYDANGNLLHLGRSNDAGITPAKDDNTYIYSPDGNTNTPYSTNRLFFTSTAAGTTRTFGYDESGQMTSKVTSVDSTGNQYLDYDVSGNVIAVYKNQGKTDPAVKFVYDEKGQRVRKDSYEKNTTEWYVRDASGNVMSIYSATLNTTNTPLPIEQPIYGMQRLGIYNLQAVPGTYDYELSDYLGNVRAVITKNADNTIDVLSWADYYPHGGKLPNRHSNGMLTYRNGYQGQNAEKDDETGYDAFELRMYDETLGRWINPDPMGQFHSPYLGMGNNPVNSVDPDGGFEFEEFSSDLEEGPGKKVGSKVATRTTQNVHTAGAFSLALPSFGELAAGIGSALSAAGGTLARAGVVIAEGAAALGPQALLILTSITVTGDTPRSLLQARKPKNGLPETGGPPNGKLQRRNPDTGELLQERYYGPDGKPIEDVDYNHDHGAGSPHRHEWTYPSPQAPNPVRGPGLPMN